MIKRRNTWFVDRGRQFAKIYDGHGTTIAERVSLDMADRLAALPQLEDEIERLRDTVRDVIQRMRGHKHVTKVADDGMPERYCLVWDLCHLIDVLEEAAEGIQMEWREWIAEMEERVELLRREAESGDGRSIEALSITEERNLPRLIEGFKLLAEAVEAHQRHIKPLWCPICDAALHDGEKCDEWCHLGAAVRFLRGVGQ